MDGIDHIWVYSDDDGNNNGNVRHGNVDVDIVDNGNVNVDDVDNGSVVI